MPKPAPTPPLILAAAQDAPSAQVAAYTNERGEVSMRGPGGDFRWVPREQAQAAAEAGLVPETREQFEVRRAGERLDAPGEALLSSALRAGSLGLLDAISPDLVRKHARDLEEANPTASTIGGLLGTVGTALVPGGPLARLGGLGERAGAAALGSARAGRVLAEGAAIGGGAGLSQSALAGQIDPAEIAKGAVAGAAMSGILSLAGAGLSAVGRKAKSLAYKAGGVDELKLQLLQGREKAIADQLSMLEARAATAPAPQVGFASPAAARLDLELTTAKAALGAVKTEIAASRQALFATAGKMLSAAATTAGFATGMHFDGMLLGLAGGGIGGVIAKAVGKRVGSALEASLPRLEAAFGAAGKAVAPLALVGRTSGARLVSDDVLSTLSKRLALTDPAEIGRAAQAGYAEAGLDPQTVDEAAQFQAARVEVLRSVVASGDKVAASRVLNAIEDPRRITRRLAKLEHYPEDVAVLQRVFPRAWSELQASARLLLDDRKLVGRARLKMMQLADPAGYSATLAVMHAPAPETTGGAGQGQFNYPSAATTLQGLQGG